ncbi:hypothetical protein ATO6_00515 [Oceanicola sp. 22II-s10i]|nr:hypothetical protein ATO6_00515 [Oceanicola sp. 22II-s10i]
MVAGHFLPTPPERIGLAVSGGSDSTALMALMAEYFGDHPCRPELHVVTVDHGLRPEAAAEAEAVGRSAGALGLKHHVLRWRGWDGQGNLQDAARRARYRLIGEWACEHGIGAIALGHTADDQAETFLMRLARASGVDGLSGMATTRRFDGIAVVRPMLSLRRSDLRGYLERRGMAWIDDPSNENTDFERVRIRQALSALEPLGLDVPTLCTVGQNLSSIRETLDWYAFNEAHDIARVECGDVVIAMRDLRRMQPEILRRILVNAIGWIAGHPYPPRRRAMLLLIEALRSGHGMTLGGCLFTVARGEVRATREFQAVSGATAAPGAAWDRRWLLTGPWPEGAEIRALGEAGLASCPDWRDTGMPRTSLLASPAVWRGDGLIAAPLAGLSGGWTAELSRGSEAFYAAFLSH